MVKQQQSLPLDVIIAASAALHRPSPAESMAAVVVTRECETEDCSKEAKLQCPTCIKLGIQGSYFCSQVAFRISSAGFVVTLREPARCLSAGLLKLGSSAASSTRHFAKVSCTGESEVKLLGMMF